MTHSEILKNALAMSIDELTKTINLYNSAIEIMKDVKRIRIRDGERTAEMIRRQARRNAAKSPAHQEKQHKPQEHDHESQTEAPSHTY